MVPGKDGGIIDHVVVGDITQPADHPVQDRALLLLLVVVGVTGWRKRGRRECGRRKTGGTSSSASEASVSASGASFSASGGHEGR